jgi:hypothetical protein
LLPLKVFVPVKSHTRAMIIISFIQKKCSEIEDLPVLSPKRNSKNQESLR